MGIVAKKRLKVFLPRMSATPHEFMSTESRRTFNLRSSLIINRLEEKNILHMCTKD